MMVDVSLRCHLRGRVGCSVHGRRMLCRCVGRVLGSELGRMNCLIGCFVSRRYGCRVARIIFMVQDCFGGTRGLFIYLVHRIRIMLARIDVVMNHLPGLLCGVMVSVSAVMAGARGLLSVSLKIRDVRVMAHTCVQWVHLMIRHIALVRRPARRKVRSPASVAIVRVVTVLAMVNLPGMAAAVVMLSARFGVRVRAIVRKVSAVMASLMMFLAVRVVVMASRPCSVIRPIVWLVACCALIMCRGVVPRDMWRILLGVLARLAIVLCLLFTLCRWMRRPCVRPRMHIADISVLVYLQVAECLYCGEFASMIQPVRVLSRFREVLCLLVPVRVDEECYQYRVYRIRMWCITYLC
jgi:hypothetical protein